MQKTLLLLAAAFVFHLGVPRAQAATEVAIDIFYEPLGEYGDWVEVGEYGYGWQPRNVDDDWRPYGEGRWAYTEAGWTWISDEPFGWAVYHYGRWARLENRGWVWIPGTEWAPAWVSWRRSPKYVGWAPLPPEARFRRNVGFSGWVDSYYDIGPSAYRFVEVRHFGAPRLRTVFIEPRQNITIIQQTTNITRITYVNSTVYNEGPRFEEIARESADPIRRLKLERRMEVEGDRNALRAEQIQSRVEGDSLRVFAPSIEARAVEAPRRLAAKIDKVEVNRGWKDAGPAAEVEKLRAKVRGEATAPKGLPPEPKFERLAEQADPAVATAPPASKDARKSPDAAPTPARPVAETQDAATDAPGTPMKAKPSGPTGKANSATVPEARTESSPAGRSAEQKSEKMKSRPAAAEPPSRPEKTRPAAEETAPQTTPTSEPSKKKERPEGRKGMPPSEKTAPQKERARPAEAAPRREAPQPRKEESKKPPTAHPDAPRDEPRASEKEKPKKDRPEQTREAAPAPKPEKPKKERSEVPKPARSEAPEAAPAPPAEKTKPGKEKDRK